MKFRILTLSKVKSKFVLQGEEDYLKRIRHKHTIDQIELAGDKLAELPPDRAATLEENLLSKELKDGDYLIALDEQGKEFNSMEFAEFLKKRQLDGTKRVTFLIGAAHGITPQTLKKAKTIVSLSRLTFPFQLTRLILTEQLYRALSILEGSPYHKE